MLRLELGHVLRVLFFKLGNLCMKLIHLVTCVRCQALNLVFETLNFLEQILYVGFKLRLGVFCLTSSALQSVFKFRNFLLQRLDLSNLGIQILLQLALCALQLGLESVDLNFELLTFLLGVGQILPQLGYLTFCVSQFLLQFVHLIR